MLPHLTCAQMAFLGGASRVVWKAPDWGFRLLALAQAIRQFRRPDGGLPA